jgi:hypothetical protein
LIGGSLKFVSIGPHGTIAGVNNQNIPYIKFEGDKFK